MTYAETLPIDPSDNPAYTTAALTERITTVLEDGHYMTDSEPVARAVQTARGMYDYITTPNTTIPIFGAGIESEYTINPQNERERAHKAEFEDYLGRTRRGELAEPIGFLAMNRKQRHNYPAAAVWTPEAPFALNFHDDLAHGRMPILIHPGVGARNQSWELMQDRHGPLPLLQVITVGLYEDVRKVPIPVMEQFRLTYGLATPTPAARG